MIRRTFLKTSTLSLVGAGLGPVALFSSRAQGVETEHSKARFLALEGQWFYCDDDPHPTLELIRVEDGPVDPILEQFTVVFRAAPGVALEEGRYGLVTDGDGPIDLHLAEAATDPSGTHYTATFSLQRPLTPTCNGNRTDAPA